LQGFERRKNYNCRLAKLRIFAKSKIWPIINDQGKVIMKRIFLTVLICYSIVGICAPNKMEGYRNFIRETNKLRLDQELKIYKKQQEFLSKFFKRKMNHLQEIAKMQEDLEWGNKPKNKKITELIVQKKKEFKFETKKLRQEFFKNELRSDIENFNLKMRQRKQAFNQPITRAL
jgi:hypothetical protein